MSTQNKGSVLARIFPGLFDAIAATVSQDQMNVLEEQAAQLEAKTQTIAPQAAVETAAPAAAPAVATPAEAPAPEAPAAPVQAAVESPMAKATITNEQVVEGFEAMKAMMESFMKAQAPAAPAPVQGSAVIPVSGDVSNGTAQAGVEVNGWYEDLKRLKAQYTKFGLTDHITV
jgi:hypothetical protein